MGRLSVLVLTFMIITFGCSRTTLTNGLSNTNRVAEVEFADRVRAEFPVGSSEQEMLWTLRWQGFRRDEANFGGERGRVPYMGRETLVPCGASYRVYWEAEDGRLTDVRGIRDVTCF